MNAPISDSGPLPDTHAATAGSAPRQQPQRVFHREIAVLAGLRQVGVAESVQRGQIRLGYFGLAKIFQEGQKGTMIGTEGYAAPEQYRGEATPASDVYGVGATLHHLLTRRDPRLEPPFTFAEQSIQDVNPNVTQEFEDIVMKALEFNPQDRYPNAAAMKDALVKLGQP